MGDGVRAGVMTCCQELSTQLKNGALSLGSDLMPA